MTIPGAACLGLSPLPNARVEIGETEQLGEDQPVRSDHRNTYVFLSKPISRRNTVVMLVSRSLDEGLSRSRNPPSCQADLQELAYTQGRVPARRIGDSHRPSLHYNK
jgi:hypothetical protein